VDKDIATRERSYEWNFSEAQNVYTVMSHEHCDNEPGTGTAQEKLEKRDVNGKQSAINDGRKRDENGNPRAARHNPPRLQ
jgi:hypothetical protein